MQEGQDRDGIQDQVPGQGQQQQQQTDWSAPRSRAGADSEGAYRRQKQIPSEMLPRNVETPPRVSAPLEFSTESIVGVVAEKMRRRVTLPERK